MRPEAKLQFDKACEALNLDDAARDRAWRRMSDLGLSPDDPTVVYLAVAGVLEKAADILPPALDALPAKVEEAAKRVVGPVARAATAKVEEAHARLAENVGDAVAAAAMVHLDAAARSRDVGIGAKLIAVALAVALVSGVAGWSLGRSNVSGVASEWAATVSRTDSRTWLALIAANADVDASIRNFCGPGSARARVLNGARACEVPLWLEGATAPAATGTVAGVYSSVLDWLYGWGPFWLLGGGLLAGLLGRKVLRATVAWRPVRWLVE